LSLTEIGQSYYRNARRIVDEAREAEREIQTVKKDPFGLLRVSVPVMFSEAYLDRWLPEFFSQYPKVEVFLETSDRVVDLIAEGFDVVIRAGKLSDTNLIARKLMTARRMTVASPSYLEEHGIPSTPFDLKDHALIDFARRKLSSSWEFANPDGGALQVGIRPRSICDNPGTELALALSGVGITRLPSLVCQDQIKSGDLISILEDYEKEALEIFAIYPSRTHLAAKVRAFIDFVVSKTDDLENTSQ